MEASTRRRMYFASMVRPYLARLPPPPVTGPPSLAVRHKDVLHEDPAPDGGPVLPVLDPLVQTKDAVREGKDGGRLVLGQDLLHLEVKLLTLALVERGHGVVENFVHVGVFVLHAVEPAGYRIARAPQSRLVGIATPDQADHE